MKQRNFAPALFLIGGVIAVTMLAPKRKRGGGGGTYQLDITDEMVRDACQTMQGADLQRMAEYIADRYFAQVPMSVAVPPIQQELVRIEQEAKGFDLTMCAYVLGSQG